MFKKIKDIVLNTDRFLYKKFGSDKSTKPLENIKEAKIIFSYLNEIGKETAVRFVGGCVRKVNFDKRETHADQAVTERYAGVGQGTGVDHEARHAL